MNVLVTGGAGYIGSHTAKQLHTEGYNPVVYDNLSYGHESFVKWGPFIHGDIQDTEKLKAVIKDHNIGSVVHFAAFAYVGESVQNPEKYYFNNVIGSLSLLQALRESPVRQIVFSSTCAIYGEPQTQPIAETEDQRPINPYGKTKLMIEQALRDYGQAYGFRTAALRYFNAAGADPEGEVGELHDPETHLIPLAILATLGKAPELAVYGKDYPTPDGTCIRDYVHVTDLARAHVLALKWLSQNDESFAGFNLGTGSGHSIKEVLQTIESVSGLRVPHQYVDRRPGDPPQLVANPSRAQEILGWKHEFTLADIIKTAYQWHRK